MRPANADKRLVYFADPMCSWCYGFSPVITAIAERFEDRMPLQLVMGGAIMLLAGVPVDHLDWRVTPSFTADIFYLAIFGIAGAYFLWFKLIEQGEVSRLVAYLFMNMGAFGVVVWVQRNGGTDFLEDFQGLSAWAPGPAALMAFFMLSLTGIPPTIGFLGKYYVFVAAVNANLTWLAVIGVLNSAVGAFYYLRVIWYMYFEEPRVAREPRPSPALLSALTISAVGVILFFIFSGPVLDAARSSVHQIAAMFIGAGR